MCRRAFTVGVGGDKIPRKGGPGITQSDLLVISKTDLADAVGADLSAMERDARLMRGYGPFLFVQVKNGPGWLKSFLMCSVPGSTLFGARHEY